MTAAATQPVWRDVMDMRQAAEYLGLSADSLYRYASEGTVPAFRFGNRWRYRRARANGNVAHEETGTLSSLTTLPAAPV